MSAPDETKCPYCGDEMKAVRGEEFLYCAGCGHYTVDDCDCEGCEAKPRKPEGVAPSAG